MGAGKVGGWQNPPHTLAGKGQEMSVHHEGIRCHMLTPGLHVCPAPDETVPYRVNRNR